MLRLLILLVGVCGAAIGCANDTTMPPITPDLIQASATTISSGGDHTCALGPDGSPVCWGANDHGQAPGVFTPPTKLTAITSGGAHTSVLTLTVPGRVGVPTFIALMCSVLRRSGNTFLGRVSMAEACWATGAE